MKQKLQTFFNKSNIKQTLLNTAYILFLFTLLYRFIEQLSVTYGYKSWQISEFLVNYQGGFVRRGLFGEILFFFAKNYNINVEWMIKIVCLTCIIVICVFFVKSFLKKGYSLYILPLCFFLGTHFLSHFLDGYGGFWLKRDHIMFCFLIAIFLGFNKINKLTIKFLFINILAVVAILIHESFAFFSLPFLFLLFFNEYKNRGALLAIALSFVFLLPSICTFLFTLVYSGDMKIVQAIWDSWVAVADQNAAEVNVHSHGMLSAIAWTSEEAFKMHFNVNFLSIHKRVFSVIFWILIIPVVYYIVTNALLVFRKDENVFTNKDKTILSSVLVFQFACLLPFFLILSCDLGRIIFYWVASSFIIFLLISKDKVEKLFPTFLIEFIERINRSLTTILYPTKTTIVLLMLFIGIPANGFSFESIVESSMMYNVLFILSRPFSVLYTLF